MSYDVPEFLTSVDKCGTQNTFAIVKQTKQR